MQPKNDKKEKRDIPNVMEMILKPSMNVYTRQVNMDNLEDFVYLPSLLHRDDPDWTPPASRARRKLLDSRHNTFLQENTHAVYLAFKHSLPVGCILCGIFTKPPEGMAHPCAFFSMFDAQDEETAVKLFDTACAYAAEKGAFMILGPWSPNGTQMETGLLADKFNAPFGYMNAYNPRTYAGYAESYGFSKHQDLYTMQFETAKGEIEKAGTKAEIQNLVGKTEGRDQTFREKAAQLRHILEVRKDELKPFRNKTVGFYEDTGSACALPDITAALARAHGRTMPLRKPAGDMDTLSFAQVMHAVSDEAYVDAFGGLLGMARAAGYSHIITAPAPCGDRRMEAAAAAYGGRVWNTYRIYAKTVNMQTRQTLP